MPNTRGQFLFLSFCFLFLTLDSGAQKQDRFWYFGANAGLNFTTYPPVPLSNGAMNAFEGCAAISDTTGALLFYTDGSMVWGRNHVPMPNGSGLYGDGKASETAIIVPMPLDLTKFYVFTVDTNGGPRGLCYSIVDMNLNGGIGDVSIKNVQLITPVTEKLTAIRHANNVDAWVIVHGWNSNNFYSFQVTATGINLIPVTSATGSVQGTVFTQSHGYMKASPDAKKIGSAIRGLRIAELFDISSSTGSISNPVTMTFTKDVYGLEFSPNSRFLYVASFANPSDIWQYDTKAGSSAAIIASGNICATYTGHFLGALQRGPDGKIYGSPYQSSTLPAFDQPDLAGTMSAFNPNSVTLSLGTTANYGLPNFLQTVFIVADFTYKDTCSGAPTEFTLVFTGADSVKWNFGDASSGTLNFSNLENPQHTFATGNNYQVELIVYQGLLTDTVRKTITIIPTPDPDLGIDVSACEGTSITFYPGLFPGSVLWQDGSSGNDYSASVSDTIWVQIDNQGCVGRDTAVFIVTPAPLIDFGPPQNVCSTDTVFLDATTQGATYLWQDLSTDPVYKVYQTGNYGVQVTVNGCVGGDTVLITVDEAPVFSLGEDTTICKGFQLFLDVTSLNASYLWNDGSTSPFYFVSDSGFYKVTVTAGTCVATDQISVDLQDKPNIFLGEDTVLCDGQPIELNAYTYGADYVWQDGSSEPTLRPGYTGKFWVTATNQCGVGADTVLVTLLTCNCNVFVPRSFTPNNDTKNDTWNYKYDCTEFDPELRIFNRIGQLVFVSVNPDNGWNGFYQGKPAEEGVYVYWLKYKGYSDGRHITETKKGTFVLLR